MSSGGLKQLVEILSVSKHSLQIDESILSDNESLLLRYVQFIHNMQAQEERIFCNRFPADALATTVFDNKHQEFIEPIKEKIPGLLATQYVINRQHLAARVLSAELHHSLHVVIKCIDKMKAYSLND